MKCPFPDCAKDFPNEKGLSDRTRVIRHVSAVHGKQAVQKLVEDTCRTRATCTYDDPTGEVCSCAIFCFGASSWEGSMRSNR